MSKHKQRSTYHSCGHSVTVLILCTMLVTLVPCIPAAQTVYVDGTNTAGPWDGTQEHPYKTITDAISVPQTTIVYIAAGTYTENVVIIHSLQLIGASSLSTIVDGGSHGHTIAVTGTESSPITVNISGLTIQHAGQHGFANLACSYASNGIISDNTIQYSQEGDDIQLDHCTGLSIHNNLISNAYVSGISLTLGSSCQLEANTIRYSQKGISLSYSSSNTITGNTITHDTVYGVYTYQSSQNLFFNNDFSMNGQHVNDPCANTWSISQQGNTWDDYHGYDNNSDGIGDTPYTIPGGSNQDDYPLGIFLTAGQQGEINVAPTVSSMVVSPTEVFAGNMVSFSGDGQDSDGMIQAYNWQSNRDGHLSTAKTFTSDSLSIGVHTITVTVQDNDGAWSSPRTTTLTVKALPSPAIDSITPSQPSLGQTVSFQGHAENADGILLEYQWSSSQDGVLSSLPAFSTANLSSGVHTISLQVRMQGREWSTAATHLLIINEHHGSQPNAPVADTGGPYQGSVGISLYMNASKSRSLSNSMLSYSWSFGDGTNGVGETVDHTYIAPGTFTVAVTVTDAAGSSSATTQVTIVEQNSQESPSSESPVISLIASIPVMVYVGLAGLAVIAIICGVLMWLRRP